MSGVFLYFLNMHMLIKDILLMIYVVINTLKKDLGSSEIFKKKIRNTKKKL